jgi:PTH1 family peptidyl-tRNA hydrolase
MKLITGLGNPGNKYASTRHNAGFIALDNLALKLGIVFRPGRGDFYLATGKFKGEEFFLLKPTTYMNNSGIAVVQFFENYFALEADKDLLVVHDDFNIPLGTLRLRQKGSDGGHNGIASIMYHLNSDEFPRMRIGIGSNDILKKDEFVDFVLSDFLPNEIGVLNKLMPVFNDCILSFLSEDIKITMNKFNRNFLPDEKDNKPENNESPANA